MKDSNDKSREAQKEFKKVLKPVLAKDGFVLPKGGRPRSWIVFARDLGPDVQTLSLKISQIGNGNYSFCADLGSKLAAVNELVKAIDLPLDEVRYTLSLAATAHWMTCHETGSEAQLMEHFCGFWDSSGRDWFETTKTVAGARDACLSLADEAFLASHAVPHYTQAIAASLCLEDRPGASAILDQAVNACMRVDPFKKGWNDSTEAAAYLVNGLEWAQSLGLRVLVSDEFQKWLDGAMNRNRPFAKSWRLNLWRDRLGYDS